MKLPGKRIDPGQMRHALTFTRSTNPRNASGGFGDTQETVFGVRGKLEAWPLNFGAEKFGPVDWTVNTIQYVATIRRRADVTEQMQIQFDGRTFKIRSAPQVSRAERYMQILCEEVKS